MNANEDIRRAYREVAREEPPPSLDAAIRAQARRAAGARPGKSVHASRWGRPVAMAAMLVLASSLVLLMEREQPDLARVTPPPASAPRVPQAPGPIPREQAQPAAPARPPPGAEAAKPGAEAATPAATAPAAVPAESPDARTSAAAPAAAPATPSAAPGAPAAAEGEGRGLGAIRDSAIRDSMTAPAPAGPAGAAGRVASGDPRRPGLRDAQSARREPQGAEQPRSESRARAAAEAAPLLAPPAPGGVEPPQAWLDRILRLRQAGRTKEADDSLAEFRRRYPDYPLPESIRTP